MRKSYASVIHAANAAVLARGDLDSVPTFFTEGYVAHLTGGGSMQGHRAVRRFVASIRRAFTNLDLEVEILVEAKARVAWQRTLRGTHKGTFKGFPATGRRIVWRDMVVSQFDGVLISEDWVITDLAERLLRARRR